MIEINLLPEELKVKVRRKKESLDSLAKKYFLYIVTLFFGVLICSHIYLIAVKLTKSYQLNLLNNKWRSLEPQRKILEGFKKEYEILSADANVIQQLIKQKINWAEKLNKLSLDLPSGVWLDEFSLSQKDFILKGSAVSLQKEEMGLINKFIDNLKNDPDFFKDFKNLDLSSVKRRSVGGYDIVDFVLLGALK